MLHITDAKVVGPFQLELAFLMAYQNLLTYDHC